MLDEKSCATGEIEDQAKENHTGNYPLTVGIMAMWTDRRFGGKEQLYLRPPKDAFMRVPDQILKTAVFLGLDMAGGREYGGTGYIVAVEYGPGYTFTSTSTEDDIEHTVRYPFMFLVTAAHVADALEGNDFYIRANKKDGSLAEIKQDASVRWWYHPTEREPVDAAVMPLAFEDVQGLDIIPIPVTMFVGDEIMRVRNLGIGDEVFVAGLFKNAQGKLRNIPIIRIGNVAMIPGEKILFPTKERPNWQIYANLIESRSIGGLSGSPVFIRETVKVAAGLKAKQGFALNAVNSPTVEGVGLETVEVAGVGRFYFFGSMIGHWHVPIGLTSEKQEAVNMGIAPMVPAAKILEVLVQAGLLEFMHKIGMEIQEKKQQKDGIPSLDSRFGKDESQFTKADFEAALKKVSRKIEQKKVKI